MTAEANSDRANFARAARVVFEKFYYCPRIRIVAGDCLGRLKFVASISARLVVVKRLAGLSVLMIDIGNGNQKSVVQRSSPRSEQSVRSFDKSQNRAQRLDTDRRPQDGTGESALGRRES